MSLLGNSNKAGKNKAGTKKTDNTSKFIKPSTVKSQNVTKKIKTTGGNRGS